MEFSHTHRHIVAVPLFALALVGVLMLGQGSSLFARTDGVPYERIETSKEDHQITLPSSDTQVLVFRGAFFELWNARPVLRDGSILVASKGLSEIYADRAVVKGINGAFHLTMKQGQLTVAALTTPVSVRMGQQSIAIPTGFQWTSPVTELAGRTEGWEKWLSDRKPVASPRKFVRDMSKKAEGMVAPAESFVAPRTASLWVSPLQFPAAQKRAALQWATDMAATLQSLAARGDAANLQALLLRPDVQKVVVQASSPVLGASLMGLTDVPAIRSEAIALLHEDSDVFMLSALHPALRSAAWTNAPAIDAEVDSDILRLALLPLSDTGEDPLSSILLQQWEQEFQGALAQMEDKGAFLAAYMPMIAKAARGFAEAGYPERAQHYHAFLLSLGATYHDALPAETQALLDLLGRQDLTALMAPLAPPETANAAAPVVVVKPQAIAPEVAERLKVDAREKLRLAGAVFSMQTSFTAVSPTSVKVSDILFSDGTVDRTLTFVWDASKNEVRDISTGGKVLPFPLAFADFVAWATGEDR